MCRVGCLFSRANGVQAWPGLYKVIMAFVKAIPQISNLFILMFLLMTIFALLGTQVPSSHHHHPLGPQQP